MRHSPLIAAAICLLLVPAAFAQQGKPAAPSQQALPGKPGAAPPQAAAPRAPAPPPQATLPGKPGATPPQAQAALPGKPRALAPGEIPPYARQVSSGTGFVIADRRVMTNHHVVQGCTGVRLRTTGGRDIDARVLRTDEERDLALLSVEAEIGPALAFRSGPEVRRGEAVVTYGFPLAGLLSSGPTLTTGDVSALAGLSDNARHYQISAPVQPGNSGGPVMDLAGNVVGIVVSKLNAQRIAQRTGDIPQNVNFAVKSTEALDWLRGSDVEPRVAATGPLLSPAEVGEMAHASTVFVRCLR
ncbi:S1C family serine protease [Humitalea sp. 24SJ18S-53]|uniref:S1C family serine protease n=1 Tax=Humitalea sp. 24SJ18S-53 TaxID=3422307 RepID=UPI003D67D0DA